MVVNEKDVLRKLGSKRSPEAHDNPSALCKVFKADGTLIMRKRLRAKSSPLIAHQESFELLVKRARIERAQFSI